MTMDVMSKEMSVYVASLTIQSHLLEQIRQATLKNSRIKSWVNDQGQVKSLDFDFSYGILRFQNRIYVPRDKDVRRTIMEEAHRAKYTIHPGATKIYKDLSELYR